MQKSQGPKSTARRRPLRVLISPDTQKSQAPKSTARLRPLRVLSGNAAPHPPGSLRRKPATPAASPCVSAATTADAAIDRLLFARSDLAGLVSQIDQLISSALQCETISQRGKQDIESFSCFLSETNISLKHWSSRLKQALEASAGENEIATKQPLGTCSISAAKGNGMLFSSNSNLPVAGPAKTPSHNLVCSSSYLPETDLIVSPSPLVSWRTGACMVESGKQLFLLTPLPKTKACSSRCPGSSKTKFKTTAAVDQPDLPNLPVWKVTISDDNGHDLEQNVKEKEARTPHFTKPKKIPSEDGLFSPFSFSIQKSRKALPSPCLNVALSGKQQVFSPISEGSRNEDILSAEPTESNRPSGASDGLLSSDEVSKDLASRYPDLYGFNQSPRSTYRRRQADEALDWFFSPPKTCVLIDSSDGKPIPTPARDNRPLGGTPWKGLGSTALKGRQQLLDDKPIQTPAVLRQAHPNTSGTPWKGLESTNLKGRQAGETTLKKELWTRFEAISTNELHFDKSIFQSLEGRSFIDKLEEEAS